ncbi:MAG: radical SAM family heme chaperone HemW [Candidatus Sumerlaeia bacterium]
MNPDSHSRPETPPESRFGVYIHVPFCLSKCGYCDFLSLPLSKISSDYRARFAETIRREWLLWREAFPFLSETPIDSIYFGGGTPSILEPAEIAAILREIEMDHPVRGFVEYGGAEITLECNPGTIERARLEAFQAAGVNRISLGVQGFKQRTLENLGRAHCASDSEKAIRAIRDAGFASWAMDLIYGVPESNLESWREELNRTLEIRPPHLSVYGLTLHEGTGMMAEYESGRLRLPDDETQRDMFLLARKMLREAGYRHYEISNYALPGHESRHNRLYWTMAQYLGLGPGAHSYLDGSRYMNSDDLEQWRKDISRGERAAEKDLESSQRSRRGECIMLALRQCEGVCLDWLNRVLDCDFQTEYATEIALCVDRGHLRIRDGHVSLTEEGLLFSDSVFLEFF